MALTIEGDGDATYVPTRLERAAPLPPDQQVEAVDAAGSAGIPPCAGARLARGRAVSASSGADEDHARGAFRHAEPTDGTEKLNRDRDRGRPRPVESAQRWSSSGAPSAGCLPDLHPSLHPWVDEAPPPPPYAVVGSVRGRADRARMPGAEWWDRCGARSGFVASSTAPGPPGSTAWRSPHARRRHPPHRRPCRPGRPSRRPDQSPRPRPAAARRDLRRAA